VRALQLAAVLVNLEIIIELRAGASVPVAVFDLSEQQLNAVGDALSHYHRLRFAGRELDADGALAMYAVGAVCDQLARLAAGGGHATVHLDTIGVGAVAEAVGLYLAERDVDSYQSPEERRRIELLRPLPEPLIDLIVGLRAAERRVGSSSSLR
jgi:hypothetical protein